MTDMEDDTIIFDPLGELLKLVSEIQKLEKGEDNGLQAQPDQMYG